MANDGVTINLSEKPEGNPYTKEYKGASTGSDQIIIKVTETTYPPNSDFLKFTHKDSGGGTQFTLAEIKDDNGEKVDVSELPKDVKNLSAYYWKYENDDGPGWNPTKALIVEVVQDGDKYSYYTRGIGSSVWFLINPFQSTQLTGKLLEEKLDEFTCEHHNAVTIDLTRNKSSQRNKYCCSYHSITDGGRVTVESVPIRCEKHHGSIPLFKYTVNTSGRGVRVAAINYYDSNNTNSPRKRIKPSELTFPIPDVRSISAFYSDNSRNPVLIYVDSSGTRPSVKGWYKQNTGGNTWENAPANLNNITPGDLENKGLDCKDNEGFKKLAEELDKLGCYGLEKCTKEIVEQQEAQAEQLRAEKGALGELESPVELGPEQEAEEKDNQEGFVAPLKAASGETADASAFEPLKDQIKEASGLTDWGIENILGAFAGVFTASCITTFVSWKLYKFYIHHSDPWVRQI
ncbi:hypothetical protein BEWA_012680 [Theileria equi strain WA]|uniref:Uncharacterized protein n=1 Tax=Theileria equi strain WA TaxID=1537102 RepID=L1LBQ9_THEEQ|nr:hypothetical protein BEWA_012680 [Theileria equi strain WA]EKX72709.1 hypothetical protein BEWA_012680 [Theileria equi strain WA]|eukprot:XP_004832161.1 hypothetical protein BEWA_012680 [Theileria equi strain WA]